MNIIAFSNLHENFLPSYYNTQIRCFLNFLIFWYFWFYFDTLKMAPSSYFSYVCYKLCRQWDFGLKVLYYKLIFFITSENWDVQIQVIWNSFFYHFICPFTGKTIESGFMWAIPCNLCTGSQIRSGSVFSLYNGHF